MQATLITCKVCGGTIATSAKFCPHCGDPCTSSEIVICKVCGGTLPPNAKYCLHCGNPCERPELVNCKVCGGRLATSAKFCPHCGDPSEASDLVEHKVFGEPHAPSTDIPVPCAESNKNDEAGAVRIGEKPVSPRPGLKPDYKAEGKSIFSSTSFWIVFSVALILILMVASCSSSSSSSQAPAKPVLTHKFIEEPHLVKGYIVGVVKNTSSVAWTSARIEFSLYDEDGNLVGTTLDYLHSSLPQGGTWKFESYVTETFDSFELQGIYVDY